MVRRSFGRTTRWPHPRLAGVLLAAALAAAVTGCGAHASGKRPETGGPTVKTKVTICGTARSAANVPVSVEIASGSVSCNVAMRIERNYARAIRDGKAPGNGGGGPVLVQGWTCEGFTTPVVLKTGKASKCVRAREEILAVLPAPAD